jgi:hypothetical protein
MSLYLYQNDQQTGPFSEEQINQMLQAGIVAPDTLGWKEGMSTWSPLSSLRSLPSPRTSPPPPPSGGKRSPLGIISFVFGIISLVLWAVLLVVAGLAHNSGTVTSTFNIIVGFISMGGICLNFMAMVLGVIGAFKSKANTLAIIGACLNGFILVALVGLIILGLAMKSAGAH